MNQKQAHAFIGSNVFATHEREENDFYATSPEAAEWLCKIENLDRNIWECACGMGHLSKVFERNGHDVLSTDLFDRGYGISGVDFLQQTQKFNGDIVTNPPFKYAVEFIYKAMELVNEGNKVCMFLKTQFLESSVRRMLFEKYPPHTIWVSSKRIQTCKCGDFNMAKGMFSYAWFVWEKGYTGQTVIKWFN